MATTAIVPYTDRFSVTKNPPDRQTSNDSGSLEEYLRGVSKQWERVARPGRVGRWYIWSQNEMFYRGMQLYTFDALEGEWEEWPEDLQDLYHTINLVLPFVEMNTSEYTKSKPKLVIYSEAGDDRKIAQAVQEAQHLADCLQERLWQPETVQREAKIVQFRGAVFTQVYRDSMRGPKVRVP